MSKKSEIFRITIHQDQAVIAVGDVLFKPEESIVARDKIGLNFGAIRLFHKYDITDLALDLFGMMKDDLPLLKAFYTPQGTVQIIDYCLHHMEIEQTKKWEQAVEVLLEKLKEGEIVLVTQLQELLSQLN